MKKIEYDYIITGQGIGGTLLAYNLYKSGLKIAIVDDDLKTAASIVAGGVINPVTGRKFQNSWMVETLLPFAKKIYRDLESEIGEKLLIEMPVLRLFSEHKEINDWSSLSGDENINPYLQDDKIVYLPENKFNNPLGACRIKDAASVDIGLLIRAFKEKFKDKISFISQDFNFNDLLVCPEYIQWKHIRARKIVFCEGYRVIKNPFFFSLPFVPVKGELLIIESKELYNDRIIHKGIGIMPYKNGTFKVGATYNWDNLDNDTTEKAENELIKKFKKIFKGNFKIIGRFAGIRPAMQDHRPVIGCHKNYKNVCIFNGLGSKGVLLAPYFANQLAEHLELKAEINIEANINRYYQA